MRTDKQKIIWAVEALQPQPEVEWIVEGLISAGEVIMFSGDPKSKKTYSAIDLGVCVALGENWLGRETQQGTVLFIDEDNGKPGMLRRLGATIKGHPPQREAPLACASMFNFRLPEDVLEMQNLIAQLSAKLVIIDTMAKIMPGRDENTVKDVEPVMTALRQIALDRQCAILVIHHLAKFGGLRGSTAIAADVDTLIELQSVQGKKIINFEIKHARNLEPLNFAAIAEWSEDQFYLRPLMTDSTMQRLQAGERYALEYMHNNGVSPLAEILETADRDKEVSAQTVRTQINQLRHKGLADRVDGGGKGNPATWQLTTAGQQLAEKMFPKS